MVQELHIPEGYEFSTPSVQELGKVLDEFFDQKRKEDRTHMVDQNLSVRLRNTENMTIKERKEFEELRKNKNLYDHNRSQDKKGEPRDEYSDLYANLTKGIISEVKRDGERLILVPGVRKIDNTVNALSTNFSGNIYDIMNPTDLES